MKRSGGITLIALVITIVITIIMAGVTINMTIGENGIITKAQRAKEQQEVANLQEKLELEKAKVVLDDNKKVTLNTYLEQLKKVGYIDNEDIQDGENELAKTIIVDNYVFVVEDLENGDVKITYEGKAGNLLPKITGITVTKTTTNSIAVKVVAKRVNGGDYKYYIKSVETGEEYSLKETSKMDEYTFTGLLQNKEYKVKVEVTNSNGTVEKETDGTIKTVTVVGLTQADIEFDYEPEDWTNGTVTATVSLKDGKTLPSGSNLQTSKNAENWYNTPSQEFTENGYIYVRIWDGTNGGSYAVGEVSKIDTTDPKVVGATPTTNSVSITATDEASGIKGYAVVEDNVEPTSFTELATSTLNFSKEVGSLKSNTIYYVWVKDEAGNVSESKEVTTEKILVTGITLNKTSVTVNKGSTTTLSVSTVTPNDAYDKSVTWSSSDTTIATVDSTGTITGKAVGITTITATAADGSGKTASCKVVVSTTYNYSYSGTQTIETVYNYDYTGGYQTVTLPAGEYKLEVWGAEGGSYNTTYSGGKGGYSTGEITLYSNTTLYIYVGGKGTSVTGSSSAGSGGYNGGASGGKGSSSTYGLGGSGGGGATDIRVESTSSYARVIVAGGGGGASGPSQNGGESLSEVTSAKGGAGGGYSGVKGNNSGQTTYGGYGGGAGSLSSGGSAGGVTTASTTTTDRTYYAGGAGGGGGGFYGGGGGRRRFVIYLRL